MQKETGPSDRAYSLFRSCSLFKGLREEEVVSLYSIAQETSLEEGEVLMCEGEKSEDFYIAIEGSFEVSRYDSNLNNQFVVGEIHAVHSIGEVSLLDRQKRSATVIAKTPAKLFKISRQELEQMVRQSKRLLPLLLCLAQNIGTHIRRLGTVSLESLRKEAKSCQIRNKMGIFLSYEIAIMSSLNYSLPGLQYLLTVAPNSTVVSLPLICVLAAVVGSLFSALKIPLEEIGITTRNWQKSLYEGVVYSIVLGTFFAVAIKWVLVNYASAYQGDPMINPFALFPVEGTRTWGNWILVNAVYCFVLSPFQELLSRGCMQGTLEKFLSGKYTSLQANIATNCLFSSFHLYFSVYFGILSFGGGMCFGWLYSRTHNLIGCSLAHGITGIIGLSIFGVIK